MKSCKYCDAEIKWMPVRGGKMLPFENAMVRRADANHTGWAPRINAEGLVFLRPTTEISDTVLDAAVPWVAILHHCEEYQDARMKIDSAFGEISEWARQMLLAQEGRRRQRDRQRAKANADREAVRLQRAAERKTRS